MKSDKNVDDLVLLSRLTLQISVSDFVQHIHKEVQMAFVSVSIFLDDTKHRQ